MEGTTTMPAQGLKSAPDGIAATPDKDETITMHAQPESGQMDVEGEDEATRLRALATDVRNQDDLERDIGRQVSTLPLPEDRTDLEYLQLLDRRYE